MFAWVEKICDRLGVGLVERKVGGDRPDIEIAGVDVADEIDSAEEAVGVIHTLERTRGVWGEHHIDAEARR